MSYLRNFRRSGLVVVLSVLASFRPAAAYDCRETGFWNQRHVVPPAAEEIVYHAVRTAESEEDANRALAAIGGRPEDASRNYDLTWIFPRDQASKIDGAVKKALGSAPIDMRRSPVDVPDFPELTFKRDRLRAEFTAVEIPEDWRTLTSIPGLVDTEIKLLDEKIARIATARESVSVKILFVRNEEGRTFDNQGDHRSHGVRRVIQRQYNFVPPPEIGPDQGGWDRSPADKYCPPPRILADAHLGFPDRASVEAVFLRHPIPPLACELDLKGEVVAAIAPEAEKEFLQEVSKAGTVYQLSSSPILQGMFGNHSAKRKTAALSQEIESHPRAFEKAPCVESFVDAELERLKGPSDAEKILGELELVRFVPESNR